MLSENPQLTELIATLATDLGDEVATMPAHRFTLFHAPNSICSQKVRVVLAHHGIDYTSHLLAIFAGQTYLPAHVRLRMMGCARAGLPLVAGHWGSTATADGGCDPAVVPTLVDHASDAVIVDSRAISLHLDATMPPAERLRPDALADVIDAELAIVDSLPNYQMLVGRPEAGDRRPAQLQAADGAGFSMGKVARCDGYLDEFAEDPVLGPAYRAKRAKELEAAERLFSAEAVGSAHGIVENACAAFDTRLARGDGPWLFGDVVTMADLFWAIELIRVGNLGATFWADGRMPALAGFLKRAEGLDGLRRGVLDFPGALY